MALRLHPNSSHPTRPNQLVFQTPGKHPWRRHHRPCTWISSTSTNSGGFHHQLGGEATYDCLPPTRKSMPCPIPGREEPIERRSEKEGKNPEDSASPSNQPPKASGTDSHFDSFPTGHLENYLRAKPAVNIANSTCTQTFDICHSLETTKGLDFFNDPMFCEALLKVSLDLLLLFRISQVISLIKISEFDGLECMYISIFAFFKGSFPLWPKKMPFQVAVSIATSR